MPIIVNLVQCIIKQIPINHSSSHIQTQQNTTKKKTNSSTNFPNSPKIQFLSPQFTLASFFPVPFASTFSPKYILIVDNLKKKKLKLKGLHKTLKKKKNNSGIY